MRILRALIVALVVAVPLAAQDVVTLSEADRLRAENHKLKIALAQAKATIADRELRLASLELSQEQITLEAKFRETLKCAPDSKFNWDTLTCTPKEAQ